MRVQYGGNIEGILVEYYDTSYNLLSTMTVAKELPIFGAFYETDSNYFLLTGQNNPNESADVEVYRITKYDKEWKRVASTGLKDCNTTVPFDAGSARMDVSGKYLMIRTSHEMYASEKDGLNHQANVTIQLNMNTMEITDSYTGVMNSGYGYVSHSFNQFIKVENNKLVTLDHGDAYPRSFALLKYKTDISTGKFTPSSSTQCEVINVLEFPGAIGQNTTGASAGGFGISGTNYLVAGNSVVQDDSNLTRETRNVFVAAVDKDTSSVTMNWITNYVEGDGTTSTPHFVKLADNSYMLLWSRDNIVYYTRIDGAGNRVGDIYNVEGNLSDCVPVVVGDKLVWYTWNDGTITFYDIAVNDLSKSQVTVTETGHQYENKGVTDGCASLVCTKCGEETSVKVANEFKTFWGAQEYGSYNTTKPATNQLVGNTFYVWIHASYFEPTDANQEMVFEVSDKSVLTYTPSETSENRGALKMAGTGTATLTIYPKYNLDLKSTYTFNVYEQLGITSFTADKTSPQSTNTEITLTTEVTGGVGAHNYKYYVVDENNQETVIQDYTSSNTCVWKPTAEGKYTVYVDVKDSNGTVVTQNLSYEVLAFKIDRATLELENDITVIFKTAASIDTLYHNLYVEVAQEKENGEVEKTKISGVKSADETFYEFRYTGVNAKEVGDNLNVTVYGYDAGENLVTGGTLADYSVKQYCMNQLSKSDSDLSASGLSASEITAFRTLMVDLLNYASQAQLYFDYKTDNLANAELTDEQKAYASQDEVLENLTRVTNTEYFQIANPTAAWSAAGLNLLSKTTVRVKFAYAGDISQVVLKATVGGVTTQITEFSSAGEGYYYAFFNHMTAYQYGEPIDFVLEVGEAEISNTLRYSVESYVAKYATDEKLGAIVSSIMKYGKAAAAYNNAE